MAAIYEAGISIIPKTGVTMSAISGAYKRVHMAWNTSVHCITVLERMVMLTKLLVLRTGVFFLVFYFFSIFRIYRIMGAALIGILLPLILLLSFMVSWGYCCYLKVFISSLYIASNCSWKTMSLAILHWRTVYIVLWDISIYYEGLFPASVAVSGNNTLGTRVTSQASQARKVAKIAVNCWQAKIPI